MPRFRFTAVDRAGTERAGVLEAPSLDQVATQVRNQGWFPTDIGAADEPAPAVAPARRSRPFVLGRVVPPKQLALFTRQLATLVQARLPLVRGLVVLARQQRNPAFRWVLESVAAAVTGGASLSDALAAHPRVFDRLYIGMVRAGEAGGQMEAVLQQLARFMEKAEKVKGRVQAALIYPAVVVTVTVLIVGALLTFVVPRFEQIFAELLKGAALPVLTQWVLEASGFARTHAAWLVLVPVGAWAAARGLRRTERGGAAADRLALHLPLVGDLARKTAVARLARSLGTLLASGVPLLPALLITRDTAGNAVIARAIQTVHDRVKEGGTIAGPLGAAGVFPPMVTSMVEVGEETGALPEMLGRIADTYEDEVDNAVSGLTAAIEPVLIVFLAVVVGTIVVALFLPIVRIIQGMG